MDGTRVDRRKDGMTKKGHERKNQRHTPAFNRWFVTKCLETWTESVSFQASAVVGLEYASLAHQHVVSVLHLKYKALGGRCEPMGPLLAAADSCHFRHLGVSDGPVQLQVN